MSGKFRRHSVHSQHGAKKKAPSEHGYSEEHPSQCVAKRPSGFCLEALYDSNDAEKLDLKDRAFDTSKRQPNTINWSWEPPAEQSIASIDWLIGKDPKSMNLHTCLEYSKSFKNLLQPQCSPQHGLSNSESWFGALWHAVELKADDILPDQYGDFMTLRFWLNATDGQQFIDTGWFTFVRLGGSRESDWGKWKNNIKEKVNQSSGASSGTAFSGSADFSSRTSLSIISTSSSDGLSTGTSTSTGTSISIGTSISTITITKTSTTAGMSAASQNRGSILSSPLLTGSPESYSALLDPTTTAAIGAVAVQGTDGAGLSAGAIIGISIGCGVTAIIIILAALLRLLLIRRRSKAAYDPDAKEVEPAEPPQGDGLSGPQTPSTIDLVEQVSSQEEEEDDEEEEEEEEEEETQQQQQQQQPQQEGNDASEGDSTTSDSPLGAGPRFAEHGMTEEEQRQWEEEERQLDDEIARGRVG